MRHSKKNILLTLLVFSPLLLSGCQVVSVKNQKINVTIANERDSILTRSKMSEASLNVLSMTGREAKSCTEAPDRCIDELDEIKEIQDEQLFSTASEIYLTKALALASSSNCKISLVAKHKSEEKQKIIQKNYDDCQAQQLSMLDKSIRYSYAYLFKTERQPQDRIFNNRQVQIRDFYNQALAKFIALEVQNTKSPSVIKAGDSTYTFDFSHYPELEKNIPEALLSTYNMNFSGLRSINRRDGFGAEFVTILKEPTKAEEDKYIVDPVHHKYSNGMNPNIHKPRYLAVSITAQPEGNESVDSILHNPNFKLKVFDPYSTEKIDVSGKSYPLAANFSAPYGLWLAENNLGAAAYLSLIDRDKRLTMPHLYMLEPYNPNKKVIVLVHGLASSPEAWIRLTNDIMGDNALREHYQVWQIFYSTNMPILESRFQINTIINQGFESIDQKSASAKDSVLIGHSMGGIIARLLVSDQNLSSNAQKMLKNRQFNRFKDDPVFNARLNIQSVPNFNRAIFISAPHRGTDYADRWFTRAARKVIKLPGAFLGALADSVDEKNLNPKKILKDIDGGLIQNGPSDLSHNSKFTQLTENVMPKKGMIYHSIMGNITNSNDPDIMTDGIVPYRSSHLDGAVSEKIIKGGHSIQETPEAVLELRRILKLHLTDHGLYKP
ncbi:lipase family alpha/beta hydrolase [Acinetobacter sp. 1207_04]|uniref:lipase family alpha/beta hydrolase n=1 Tax=Acinetobacter sp. 1207_04 TaxID=2604449 RepID=UPI0040592CB1